MPTFSSISQARLATCHPDLQKLFSTVIQFWDCSVTAGFRNKADQDAAYHDGKSTKPWPQSKHNSTPSMAVDVYPYPIDFNDEKRMYAFAGFVLGIATSLHLNIRWGGDWNQDHQVKNETFIDLPHFELV